MGTWEGESDGCGDGGGDGGIAMMPAVGEVCGLDVGGRELCQWIDGGGVMMG